MTMPQTVQDARSLIRGLVCVNPRGILVRDAWEILDAELHRLTEIAEGATAKVEAANALLRSEATLLRAWARESREGGWSTHQVGPMNRRADELDKHLQGAGDDHQ